MSDAAAHATITLAQSRHLFGGRQPPAAARRQAAAEAGLPHGLKPPVALER